MKHLKTLVALIFAIGLLGISQAYACKAPGLGIPAGMDSRSAAKPQIQPIIPAAFDTGLRIFTKKDLSGRYSSLATATFFDPTSNRTQFATCIGIVTFDGKGRFTDFEVHSYDGTIVRDSFVGTYTVKADGRGTMHFIGENEEYDYEFVMSNDVNEITFLITLEIPGVVSYGTLKKQ
ncbi:hypothetical protein BH10ACI2_BH10ACI2_08070 [soil metagenome]